MTLQVIGVGVGRTGTRSLKLALNRLGLGPCHHMEDVLENMAAQVPLWAAAVAGRPDWNAIFSGYKSAVDWPTAGFFRDLAVLYPSAKFVLTTRSPESWTESFSQTVYKVLAGRDRIPEEMREWFNMASTIIAKDGFPDGLDSAGLTKAFIDHNDAVKAVIPAGQLLSFQAKDGWGPLCSFLGLPVPDEPFPRTNDRAEFWERLSSKL